MQTANESLSQLQPYASSLFWRARKAQNTSTKKGTSTAPWTKVKFDRQIVAIAKVNECKRLYSDDGDVINFGEKAGLEVISTWKLPLPLAKQTNMFEDDKIKIADPNPKRIV